MKDVKVAIVGSSESHWTANGRVKAVLYIHNLLDEMSSSWLYKKVTLISGGCPKGGVDIFAEMVADELGLEKEIYRPEVNQWKDKLIDESIPTDFFHGDKDKFRRYKGYMSRNIQIAETCDVLYCIDPKGRVGGGGFWTYSKAKTLGKEVHHVVIE
jgi:hypothetical protein